MVVVGPTWWKQVMAVTAANPTMAHPVDHPCLLRGDELSFAGASAQVKGVYLSAAASHRAAPLCRLAPLAVPLSPWPDKWSPVLTSSVPCMGLARGHSQGNWRHGQLPWHDAQAGGRLPAPAGLSAFVPQRHVRGWCSRALTSCHRRQASDCQAMTSIPTPAFSGALCNVLRIFSSAHCRPS